MTRSLLFVTTVAEMDAAVRDGAVPLTGSYLERNAVLNAFRIADTGQLVASIYGATGWYVLSTPERPVKVLWSDTVPDKGPLRRQAEWRVLEAVQ